MNEHITKWYEENSGKAWIAARALWSKPEIAYEEVNSCCVLADYMKENGFDVKTFSVKSKNGKPNALKATFGSGHPVIGILGELDALPGLCQTASSHENRTDAPGHGCGHNLLGAGCAAAAAAAKYVMEQEALTGTIVYYGCPAEEVIAGKVLMASMGCFDELDLCMTWHPGGGPSFLIEFAGTALTNIVYEFHGKSAHAADNAHMGRSALDAVELMNIAGQYLREHVTKDVSFHYCYRAAGEAPNIVPDYAAVNYYIRANTRERCDAVLERITNNARAAALMTETRMTIASEIGCYEFLVNHTLNRAAYEALLKIPPIEYSEEDYTFARDLYKNVQNRETEDVRSLLRTDVIEPSGVTDTTDCGSTDVADVTQLCPTVNTYGTGLIGGIPGHHWSVTACAGSDIGRKGMLYSSKGLAQLCFDVLTNPDLVQKVKQEFTESRAAMPPYQSRV